MHAIDQDTLVNEVEEDMGSEYSQEDEDELETLEDLLEWLTIEEFEDAMAKVEQRTMPSSSTTLPALGTSATKIQIPFNYVTMDCAVINGDSQIKPGMVLELQPDVTTEQAIGDFLQVHTILEDLASDETILRGIKFRRTKKLKGMLEKKTNEVYMLLKHDEQDPRDIDVQSLEDVPAHAVLCARSLILTNQLYPHLGWKTHDSFSTSTKTAILESGRLVCRWKHVVCYSDQRSGRIAMQRPVRISEEEADKEHAVSDKKLRFDARRTETGSTGVIDLTSDEAVSSYRQAMRKHRSRNTKVNTVIDIDDDEVAVLNIVENDTPEGYTVIERMQRRTAELQTSNSRSGPRRVSAADEGTVTNDTYTFLDGFCGAGGISSGARAAGLRIKWAFDMWGDACNTYRANFDKVRVYQREAFDVIAGWKDGRVVDILHLSPPCQKFSPAHTVEGKNDDHNVASLFAVGCLIQKTKPRVVTIEETSGIQTHHPIFLHALILQLTRLGYSVAWKVMNFAEYGLAQPRMRLVIIACW